MAVYALFSPGTYTATQARTGVLGGITSTLASSITPRSGVLSGPLTMVVSASSGMTVNVGAGHAMVAGWKVVVDATTPVTLDASTSTARTDLVILRVRDAEAGDGVSSAAIEVVKGTSTTPPALPSARCLTLAQISVGASVSSITSANITDVRTFTAAAGGVINIPGASTVTPSAAGVAVGQWVWDSTNRVLGNAISNTLWWTTEPPQIRNIGVWKATVSIPAGLTYNQGNWSYTPGDSYAPTTTAAGLVIAPPGNAIVAVSVTFAVTGGASAGSEFRLVRNTDQYPLAAVTAGFTGTDTFTCTHPAIYTNVHPTLTTTIKNTASTAKTVATTITVSLVS